MRNNRGYSLIELLGVIIIIGLILLVVIPAVSRLLTNNEYKEYNNYLKIVETGAKSYADKMYDELGFTSDVGCYEVSLDDLIKEKYIKEFNDKNITCTGKVRLNNDEGNLKTTINLTCTDKDNKETFKQEKITADACISFVPKEEGGLAKQITKNGVGSYGIIGTRSGMKFVRGSNPNNYVWYSGKLWRVVWFTDEVVKLISTDLVTALPRNNTNNIRYENSTVDRWLQEVFLPTLNNYNDYLIDTKWDVGPTSSYSFFPSGSEVIDRKIGLLNSVETYTTGAYIPSTYHWMLSNYYGNLIRFGTKAGSGGVSEETFNYQKYYAIRPAITMKASVFVLSGNGSYEQPYILEGNNDKISKGTLLNTRYSGEYLKLNNELYRIVEVKNGLTKVIKDTVLGTKMAFNSNYDDSSYQDLYSYDYAHSSIKDELTTWYENELKNDKSLVFENGSWCFKVVGGVYDINSTCTSGVITAPVGLPSIGDIYTVNNNANVDTFWTIDPYNISTESGAAVTMNIINYEVGKIYDARNTRGVGITANVKPVMYLKENVIITSGNGMINNPYTLELK